MPFVRPLAEDDGPALAQLMFDAYSGTIDDAGEPLEGALAEVHRTFAGEYGRMLWDASFVATTEQDHRVLLSASVVTLWREAPLLAFSMTQPAVKRQGLAAGLIGASALSLAKQGHTRLVLFVTAGNTSAERLYEKLGFVDIPPP